MTIDFSFLAVANPSPTETHLQRLDAGGVSFVQALAVDQPVAAGHMSGTGSAEHDLGPNSVWPVSGSATPSIDLDQTPDNDQQTPPKTADTATSRWDFSYQRQ